MRSTHVSSASDASESVSMTEKIVENNERVNYNEFCGQSLALNTALDFSPQQSQFISTKI